MTKNDSEPRTESVAAPYKLPAGWKWVQQNEVCKLTDGEKRTGEQYPYLEVKYLRGTKEKQLISEGKFIKAGTKVILVDGENSGEVFTVNEDGYMGSTFKALEIQNINENFLQFFIATKKDIFKNNKKGSAIPHLDKKLFFSMPFPLPPSLAEQQRIVSRIESLFTKLDEAKDKAQSVVDGFELRRAAILHNAFTGELTAKWRKEHGVSNDSWEEKTIGECLITISDKYDPEKDKIEGIQYIGLENIEANGGIISTGDASSVKSIKTLFKSNDLLYGKLRPYLDKHDISDFDGICSTDILVYRSKIGYEIKFFNYLFSQKRFIQYAVENSKGINLPRTSEKSISAYSQKIPTLPEQQEIVRILDSVLEKEADAKETAEYVLEQIGLLKKSILARAFRGEL